MAIKMELGWDSEDSFGPYYHCFSCTPTPPLNYSAASSFYEFSTHSDRSTPFGDMTTPPPLEFESPFESPGSSASFDMTPSPSSVPSYSDGEAAPDFTSVCNFDGLPNRKTFLNMAALHNNCSSMMSSNPLSMGIFQEQVHASPPLMAVSMHHFGQPLLTDALSTWTIADDGPVTFSTQKQAARRETVLSSGTHAARSRHNPSLAITRGGRRPRKPDSPETATKNFGLNHHRRQKVDHRVANIPLSIVSSGTFKCPEDGCFKKYKRMEHLKRHINT
jgi:hypothetical protein